MTKIIRNTYKSKITSFFGVVVYGLTSWLIYKGSIVFFPDALVGYSIGTLLLFSPDSIINLFKKIYFR